MNNDIDAPQVGAPDPELNNSPVVDAAEREFDPLKLQVPGEPVCFFNSVSYPHGSFVHSGTVLLRCDYGVWVRAGSSDPDNQ